MEARKRRPAQGRANGSGAPDGLSLLLRRAGSRPLLSAEEEVRLARRARSGCSRSRRELAERNLRLVVSVAARFTGRGMDLEDLVQEGNVGLMRAVDRFDPDRGHRFSTYATWWIRQAVQRGLHDRGRAIRLPVGLQERLAYIRRTRAALQQNLGREPTLSEVAAALGMSETEVRESIDSVRETVSMNAAATRDADGGDRELGDLLAAPQSEPDEICEELDLRTLRENLPTVLSRLEPRDRFLLVAAHGLDGREPMPRRELARELGLSGSRTGILLGRAHERLCAILRREVRAVTGDGCSSR
jgi:RNA polymerase primary sigma factor